jgi:hypothetical protein
VGARGTKTQLMAAGLTVTQALQASVVAPDSVGSKIISMLKSESIPKLRILIRSILSNLKIKWQIVILKSGCFASGVDKDFF